jgi:predicted acetyltransferase
LRWQHGTEALPPHCFGHIGYGVVPWKRGRGYAREAIRQLLPEAWSLGLRYVEITTEADNVASQRAALGAGAQLHEQFVHPPSFGGRPGLRYRIYRG